MNREPQLSASLVGSGSWNPLLQPGEDVKRPLSTLQQLESQAVSEWTPEGKPLLTAGEQMRHILHSGGDRVGEQRLSAVAGLPRRDSRPRYPVGGPGGDGTEKRGPTAGVPPRHPCRPDRPCRPRREAHLGWAPPATAPCRRAPPPDRRPPASGAAGPSPPDGRRGLFAAGRRGSRRAGRPLAVRLGEPRGPVAAPFALASGP